MLDNALLPVSERNDCLLALWFNPNVSQTSTLTLRTTASHCTAHPKLWAMVQYLLQFQDRETFHGIIFSREFVKTFFLCLCPDFLLNVHSYRHKRSLGVH